MNDVIIFTTSILDGIEKMITIETAKLSDVDEMKEVLRNTWISTYADSLSHDWR